MKKILLIAAICGMTFTAFSQAENYRMVKVDLGMLYAVPGTGFDAGIGFFLEPKFNITDNIAAGLRWESALLAAVDAKGNAKAAALGSWSLTGDYYVGTSYVRPFGGLGVGIYSMAAASVSNGTTTEPVELGSKPGFILRGGATFGHFRAALAYNIITGTNINVNYLAIKLGWEIGGGPK